MHSESTENYLKAVYSLQQRHDNFISTSELSGYLSINPASVSEMVKKMHEKELLEYKRSKGVKLTEVGERVALKIIRRHRLWETFLVERLEYSWDEVHDLAEQLEHINSHDLIDRIDKLLGFPKTDPHGEPIPDKDGVILPERQVLLSEMQTGGAGRLSIVHNQEPDFLRYFDEIGLKLGADIQIQKVNQFDGSVLLTCADNNCFVSQQVAQQVSVVPKS
ncbi:MAG: metal-dependent transcriptional regulator [Cytophagales bacterium]|nr:metal-dependent transcriptional regulator [Cytophagales bacterium]